MKILKYVIGDAEIYQLKYCNMPLKIMNYVNEDA